MALLRRKKPVQLTFEDARKPTGRGGWRPGAGRPKGRTKVAHERRQPFAGRYPQHVTLRVVPGIGTLRRYRQLGVVKQAIAAAQCEGVFQICEFNLLGNHVHLIIEAAGAVALARGMQGLAVRLARRLNAVLGRKGKLFAERYHARCLKTPREVRNALRYVLLNSRHHAAERGEKLARYWIDPFSSAAWFTGWQEAIRVDQPWKKQLLAQAPPTLPATVWLLKTGWQRWGLLSFDEIPGGHETA